MNTSLPIFPKREVLTTNITLGTFADHIEGIAAYGAAHRSSYVCCVNAHMTVEARDADLARVVKEADMATADGMPVLFAPFMSPLNSRPRCDSQNAMCPHQPMPP